MKIKTFVEETPDMLDARHNQFAKDHDVKAGQYKPLSVDGKVVYTMTVWYKEE